MWQRGMFTPTDRMAKFTLIGLCGGMCLRDTLGLQILKKVPGCGPPASFKSTRDPLFSS